MDDSRRRPPQSSDLLRLTFLFLAEFRQLERNAKGVRFRSHFVTVPLLGDEIASGLGLGDGDGDRAVAIAPPMLTIATGEDPAIALVVSCSF